MSQVELPSQLEVPRSLANQLYDFRRQVWIIKLLEGGATIVAAVAMMYLTVFTLDRLWDTPFWVRAITALAALGASVCLPYYYLHFWVWQYRGLKQLARLLSKKLPRVGDQLLGVLELAEEKAGQQHSMRLAHAAIEQVAADAKQRDLTEAMPESRAITAVVFAGTALTIWALLFLVAPLAAQNAWARFATPWLDTPRYTFADVESLPNEIVVPHGEAFSIELALREDSAWNPTRASMSVRSQSLASEIEGNTYRFEVPPQIADTTLHVRVGDWMQAVHIQPMVRPELTSMEASIQFPEYLQRPEPQQREIRGGSLSVVEGATVTLSTKASRELAAATVNGKTVKPMGDKVSSAPILIDKDQQIEFNWTDIHQLTGKRPFEMSVLAEEDLEPSLMVQGLPRRRVVLDSEQLRFDVTANDDYGVREVGIQWQGLESELISTPAEGEKVLASGGPENVAMDVQGTFTATSLGIEPQAIELQVFVTDYLPGRERVVSSKHLLFVLNAEDHAIWVTEQLARWHRQALEVRDKELRLYEENKELRDLTPEELATSDAQHRLEQQAAAERANGRNLANLTESGEELLRQAARNSEIGVGHLDRWAEMLQVLDDISKNRMPSVADLLEKSARSPASPSQAQAKSNPMAGQNKDGSGGGKPSIEKPSDQEKPAVPMIADQESSQQPPGETKPTDPQEKNPSTPSQSLVQTTLAGKPSDSPPVPAPEQVEQAVNEQQDLLKEFEKIANELNEVLANMEGSTLVKRLKAESRKQLQLADRIADEVPNSFGKEEEKRKPTTTESFTGLSNQFDLSESNVSLIMDDMQAYFERRRMVKFKTVLDDMRAEDVLMGMRSLADEVGEEPGISMAQAEFWSDTIDRWAEDLVDPANSGSCPGGRSKGSLPPSIILEVLKILEGEINLREETRVAEQARPGLEHKKFVDEADRLKDVQDELSERVGDVISRILELPGAREEFGDELKLLAAAQSVMDEAATILGTPETGNPAIGAETEAIELLLQSKRINPNGGGGGGSSPGGGGSGTTQDSALALLGEGLNEKEVKEAPEVVQSTGTTDGNLPEEFQAGLNEYFHKIESGE